MLTGEDLGRAIRAAIQMKGVSQRAVATHFGVKPPSIQDWMNRGVIGKDKLPALWEYFSDVVGPEHWGLREWPAAPAEAAMPAQHEPKWPFSHISPDEYQSLSTYDKKMVENLVRSMLEEKQNNPRPPAPDIREQMEKVRHTRATGGRHGELQHVPKK